VSEPNKSSESPEPSAEAPKAKRVKVPKDKPAKAGKVRDPLAPVRGQILSVRFVVALLLMAAGIAYVVVWTLYMRDLERFESNLGQGDGPSPLIPGMKKLDDWNWLVGFGLLFVGLSVAAHKKTPLGRGQGVVVGMLGCFLIGLVWICTFYVFADKIADDPNSIFLLGSLGQLNLLVGIGFMAVGFTFATKWE
jgi:hypothetical protein